MKIKGLAEHKAIHKILGVDDEIELAKRLPIPSDVDVSQIITNVAGQDHSTLANLSYATAGHTGFLQDANDVIKDTHIDWGIGADQVSTTDMPEGTNLYFTDERVDDRVASLIQNGTGISWTYDDVANTLTGNVSITQYTDEMAQDAVGGILVDSSSINFTYDDAANTITATTIAGGVDHGGLTGLSDDDHIQYALLAGRSDGQTIYGGINASGNLTLLTTSHTTKGTIFFGTESVFQETNSFWGFGTTLPEALLHVAKNDITAPAWGIEGILLRIGSNQVFDSSSSGTVVINAVSAFRIPTLNATNITTYTDVCTLRIGGAPEDGTNVTSTNRWALLIDRDNVRMDGFLAIGLATTPQRHLHIQNDGVTAAQMILGSKREAIVANNLLGGVDFWSNDSNLTAPGQSSALIAAYAGGTHTATDLESYITLSTTPDASTTVTEVLRITSGGTIRLNGLGADPSVLSDGDIWHRSDLDLLRFRLNGVSYNPPVTGISTAVPIIMGGIKAVAGSATTVTITFGTDDGMTTAPAAFPTNYLVTISGLPDWATSVRVSTAPTTTSVVLTFGTATGTGGGNFYWTAVGYKIT